MRSGLARARGLGAAGSRTETFWRQRVTSVLGLPLVLGLLIVFWKLAGTDYASARLLIANPVVAVLMVMVIVIVNFAVHMRLGAQVVIEDYVHRPVLKPLLLMINTGTAFGAAIVAALAVIRISAFG
ncbi:succinate dehydrogenase, hydrophobic membrane anchor protein [Aquamicrobium soli]|uniref:Succinate dehydrogenase hydrophobic membrane anchor subunit n=1 Tax=Aquamicrobium soli TaxID=1811518 RepID=A0ABV7KJG6_9HYPH